MSVKVTEDGSRGDLFENVDVLESLAHGLRRSGYGEYYACFSPLAPRPTAWQNHRGCLPKRMRPVVDLFLLGESVDPLVLPTWLRDLVEPLSALGLIHSLQGNRIRTPGLIILPVLGNWLICQRPQINPTIYFGDDSVAIMMRVVPRPDCHVLDLCSGPGVQALHCARFARRVTAVEINPVAANLARLNARLNGCADRIEVVEADLYGSLGNRKFEMIVANPPLLPFPQEIKYPFVGHGGTDGLKTVSRILVGLPKVLEEDGVAQIIGTTLSDGVLPIRLDYLESVGQRSELSIRISLVAHLPLQPGSAYFEGLVETASIASQTPSDIVRKAFTGMLANQHASHLCTMFFHVVHGKGGIELMDVSSGDSQSLWYV